MRYPFNILAQLIIESLSILWRRSNVASDAQPLVKLQILFRGFVTRIDYVN
jgi:hypothetical protein